MAADDHDWLDWAEQSKAQEARLDEALRYISYLTVELERLRSRRAVRAALRIAPIARRPLRTWRWIRRRLTHDRRHESKATPSPRRPEVAPPILTEGACEDLMAQGAWAQARNCWLSLASDETYTGEASAIPRRGVAVCSALSSSGEGDSLPRFVAPRPRRQTTEPFERVVFGATTGGVDGGWHPGWTHPDFEYFRFSDEAEPESYGLLHFRPLEYLGGNARRSARWAKTHPHLLFPHSQWAVWMDGNVVSLDSWETEFDDFVSTGRPIGLIKHPLRQTTESEATECIRRNKDSTENIRAHMARNGRDPGVGLYETNLVMFNLAHQELRPLLATWWSLILSGSQRDQVSLPYALHRHAITPHVLLRGMSLRSDARFALLPHAGLAWERARESITLRFGVGAPPANERKWLDEREQLLTAQQTRTVDIIIPIHNALSHVQHCVSSVLESRNSDNHRLILVDDGSDREAADYLTGVIKGHGNVDLLRSEAATGFCKAANRGLRASAGEMVILLNSDAEVVGDWIYKLADAMYRPSGVGIVGPFSNAASFQSWPRFEPNAEEVEVGQTVINEIHDDLVTIDQTFESSAGLTPIRVDLIHGFCFAIRREVLDDVGLLDEGLFPEGFGEEVDYCFRAIDAGWSLAWATNTFVFHAKTASYSVERRRRLAALGTAQLIDRHGAARRKEAIAASLEQRRIVGVPSLRLSHRAP